MRGVAIVDHLAEPERADDERRVGLDVRAHDEDVARLEGVVVGQQAEQHLAQHVDLTGRPVAAVHLDRAVGLVALPRAGPDFVGADVGLQPAEQGVGSVSGASPTD